MSKIAGYRKNKSSSSDVNSWLRLLSSINQQDDTTYSPVRDRLSIYSDEILNSFDNETFNANMNQLENWYSQNVGNLDSGEIERYNNLKEQADMHKKKYTAFDLDYAVMHNQMENIKTLVAGGFDENGNEIPGYNDLDDNNKAFFAERIKDENLKYIESKEKLIKQYGDLLQHPSGKFSSELFAIDAWDDIYRFSLASIEDHVIDKNELFVISSGIDNGNLDEHKNYIQSQENHKRTALQYNLNLGIPLIEELNFKGNLIDEKAYIMNIAENDPELYSKIKDKVIHTTKDSNPYYTEMPTELRDVDYTYQDLVNLQTSDLEAYYKTDIDKIYKDLYPISEGYKNLSFGQNITNVIPGTYKKHIDMHVNNINDPYVRLKSNYKKEEDITTKGMGAEEIKIIEDYEKDVARYEEIDKWFKDNPNYTTEEGAAIASGKDIRKEYSNELKALKSKYKKKRTYKYGKLEKTERLNDTIFNISKQYGLELPANPWE